MIKPSKVSFFNSVTSLAAATAAKRRAINEVFMVYDVEKN